jgi:predicted oxidoreductase
MAPLPIEKLGISNSRLVYGCMALGGKPDRSPVTRKDVADAEAAVDAALSIGITMFDHADVYRHGKAEAVFGEVLGQRTGLREQLTIQSKCGVRLDEGGVPVQYDLSRDWIVRAVDGILQRLRMDYLDVLLLHRPDPLMRGEEVSDAFSVLSSTGKVRYFGVSNMSGAQMAELQRHLETPLVVNQLEMSLARRDWIEQDLAVNDDASPTTFPAGTIQYCLAHDVQLQAWGPLARGLYSGADGTTPSAALHRTSELVSQLAAAHATSKEAIVLAWLLKHPAGIQPVIGTANPDRIRACADAVRQAELMTRSDWYGLLASARGANPP